MRRSIQLSPQPGRLNHDAFREAYAGIYEDSPWVAEAVWVDAATGKLNTLAAMQSALQNIVENAGIDAQLMLIRAHPELAGRAAIRDDLTTSSKQEQAGAGLDQCSPEEFTDFQRLNTAYDAKFSFPFIIAVTGLTRTDILTTFRARLGNDYDTEFATALAEIHKIAAIRLNALTKPEPA